MRTVNQYQLTDLLHDGKKTSVYRGEDNRTRKAVVVKLLKSSYPVVSELAKLRQEFEIARSIDDCEGIVHSIALEDYERGLALILEDFDGVPLNSVYREKRPEVAEFLDIAISLVATLGQIHHHNIIHKDIKPSNMILNPSTKDVKISDFGISSRLSRENPQILSPNRIEGTLPYISPEQTGRMNRAIDHRSDFYSLGVAFYEILTGQLPFPNTGDPMELIHAHIAIPPKPPKQLRPDLPDPLNAIIMKLLAKNAEDRYQSAHGLNHDLTRCLEQLRTKGTIDIFDLGERDFLQRFQLPQKLYGRVRETGTLLEAYKRVSTGQSELMLVKGFSGIGKSMLVNEVHKPMVEMRGYFIAGKFDQFKRDIPYSSIIQAFQDLTRQILTETEEETAAWKQKLTEALGVNGQVVVDVIPEVEYVIGKQPPVPELSPAEAQSRFNQVFKEFVKACASLDHPLTIFLDDLQWADNPSLQFIETIITDPDIRYLFLIGAYRDNEVSPQHPLVHTVREIEKAGSVVEAIALKPLAIKSVNELISDTLHCGRADSQQLAELVHQKTDGNPFFVSEFMKSLYEDRKLNFDANTGQWSWDIAEIQQLGLTDNVVELMSGKLRKLKKHAQAAIRLASCVGNQFDLKTLSIVSDASLEEIARSMNDLLLQGFVLPVGDGYKYVQDYIDSETGKKNGSKKSENGSASSDNGAQAVQVMYRFPHDRVQQAAYDLIPENERASIHLAVGRHIQESKSGEELEEEIFTVVNHLNKARELVTEREGRLELAQLNLNAALKAKKSAAYTSALVYLGIAVEFLDDEAWDDQYEMAWKIYAEKAANEYSTAQFEECDKTLELVLARSKTEAQRTIIYQIYLNNLFSLNRHEDGIKIMRQALKELGHPLPRKINKVNIALQFALLRITLLRRRLKVDDLLELPTITDQKTVHKLQVLLDSVPSTYIAHPDSMGYISLVMARLSIKYGNSIYAPFAYAMVSLVMTGVSKEFKTAYEFATMALKLNEKYPDLQIKGRGHFLLSGFSLSYRRNVEEYKEHMTTAVHALKEVGSLNWADYAVNFTRPQHIFFNKKNLEEIEEENHEINKMIVKHADKESIGNQTFLLNFIQGLRGIEGDPNELKYDEESYAKEMEKTSNFLVLTNYLTITMVKAYMMGDSKRALDYGWRSFKVVLEVLGNLIDFVQRYYYCLTYLRCKQQGVKTGFLHKVAYKINKFLAKRAQVNAPQNFGSHYDLLLAEEARVGKNKEEAARLYDSAIEKAAARKFHLNTALANELAADFYQEEGKTKIAQMYMSDAVYAYQRLGARAKVTNLEERYPKLVGREALTSLATASPSIRTGTAGSMTATATATASTSDETETITEHMGRGGLGSLDLGTVMKASQAISGEIRLEKLLERLMKIVMENAGAQKGLLLLDNSGSLHIEANAHIGRDDIDTMQSIPAEQSDELARSIVHYVSKTRQDVVLNNASADAGQFTGDAYIQKQAPKSIICSPMVQQGRLIGVVYLENNLSAGAFTQDRLSVLKLLSSQAAISIDNARLYSNLEEKVEERTAELRESKKEIDDIMANVQQGLLTVNRDGTISSEYSSRVAEIFERDDLGEKKFEDMYIHDPQTKAKVGDFLDQMLNNPFMSEKLFARANPLANYSYKLVNAARKEVVKVLDFNFSRIHGTDEEGNRTKDIEKIMVVIDDRTEEFELKRELEQKAQEQASKVEKLYQILQLPPNVFSGFISESSVTLDTVYQNLNKLQVGENSPDNLKLLQVCYREVHTLKGNARALNLDSIGKTAHELEDVFDELKEKPTELTQELKDKVFEAVASLKNDIQDGNSLFEKILNMQSALQTKSQDAMGEFEERFRNIVDKEAQELGKQVSFNFKNELSKPLEGSIMIKLRNPLSHIIRNSMSHGIESNEERAKLGKEPGGRITVVMSEKDGHLLIACEDDGSGLKTDKIKEKAIEQKLITAEKAANMNESEIHKLIFASGLSTADKVSDIAGRGVGMDAVREDLKALNSVIMVASKPRQYTRFTIKIPMP